MKKQKWIIISLVAWALIWAVAVGMRSLSQQATEELAATPTVQKPELEEVESKSVPPKVDLYRDEIQKEKKSTYTVPEEDRKERVQMAWNEVYKEKGDDGNTEEEAKLLKESITSSAAPAISRKQHQPEAEIVKIDSTQNQSSPQAGFHTQVFSPTKEAGASIAKANIWTEQEVRAGGAVKLKTSEAFVIDGKTIPAGTMFIGTCRTGKRLFVEIKQIRLDGKLQPVNLKCLDASDMQSGLIIPKYSLDEEMQKELTDAAVDEVLSQVPVGGGILQSGKRIIQEVISGRNKGNILLPHGYEIIISP